MVPNLILTTTLFVESIFFIGFESLKLPVLYSRLAQSLSISLANLTFSLIYRISTTVKPRVSRIEKQTLRNWVFRN